MSRGLKTALIITAALVAVGAGIAAAFLGGNTIYSGVSVSGIQLGGLTVEQAQAKLQPAAEQSTSREFVVHYRGGIIKTTTAELGGRIDVPATAKAAYEIGREGGIFHRLGAIFSAHRRGTEVPMAFSFDDKKAKAWLLEQSKKLGGEPVNASLKVVDGQVQVIPGKPGVKIDTEKSLRNIVEAVNSGKDEADLAAVVAKPKITEADFKGIEGIVSSYSTTYKPWQRDRTHNLEVACKFINGTLLKPGEVFSYNKVVGPREKKYGFRDAPMFVNGEVEDGTGGGVCQVSTTLYNAALLANMKIVRRQHHSQPVTYAPVGRDATVAYPVLDFKFQNTSDVPIYIMAWIGDRKVNITFLGKPLGDTEVRVVTEGHKVIPASVVQKADETLEPGTSVVKEKGRSGHRVSVYRIIKVGGEIVKRELVSNDYYRPESKVLSVGPAEL